MTAHLTGPDEPEEPRPWGRVFVVAIIVAILVFVGYRMLVSRPDARARDAAGNCLLRARVYTSGEGTPGQRRIFGMQNQDNDDWTDVQIAISGVVTAGAQEGKPTGSFTDALPSYNATVEAHKSREVPLEEFQNAGGPRWVPMTMRVRHAKVTAKIGGETCTYESDLPQKE